MTDHAITPEELRKLARAARSFVRQLDAPALHKAMGSLANGLEDAATTVETLCHDLVATNQLHAAGLSPPAGSADGLTGADIAPILNRHRILLQRETRDIGDGLTCAAFVMYSFILDKCKAMGLDPAEEFARIASEFPAEAERFGMKLVRTH